MARMVSSFFARIVEKSTVVSESHPELLRRVFDTCGAPNNALILINLAAGWSLRLAERLISLCVSDQYPLLTQSRHSIDAD
jgi:hypothetical protein